MKILMVSPFPPKISGGSKASYYFFRYLKEKFNHDITVLSHQKFQNNNIKVKNVGLTVGDSLIRGIAFLLLGFIRGTLLTIRIKPQLIYSKQLMTPSITACLIAKCSRKPLISHTAGPDIQDLDFLASHLPGILSKIYYIIFSRLRLMVLKYSSVIVCNCQADYQALQKLYPNNKSILIYNGVKLDKFKYNPNSRKEIRTKLSLTLEEKLIIYTGQANKQKQTNLLLKIIENNPKYKFLIVGPTISELLQFGKISDNAIITGPIYNGIEKYLSASDLFILPSKHEGLSNSILEALAQSLPIIVTPVGEAPYIIDHKIHGILSEVDNFDHWIKKIIDSEDKSLMNTLKLNSRLLVEKKFNWSKSAQKMSDLFDLFLKNETSLC